jgi:hypothetical protein
MPLLIPTSVDLSSYVQRTTMDGVDYLLRFQFNQRLGRWFVDVRDVEENPIAMGLPLVVNYEIGRWVVDERWLAGRLATLDQEAANDQEARDPGLIDLGARVLLSYLEAAELAEIEAAGA